MFNFNFHKITVRFEKIQFKKKLHFVFSALIALTLVLTQSDSSHAAAIFQREADIVTGTYGPSDSNPSYMVEFDGKLYFTAYADSTYEYELYVYDGVNPPSLAADIYPGKTGSYPTGLVVFNNALYFGAYGNASQGTELWKYDGINPPSLVADIYSGTNHSIPEHLTVFNNTLYFSADGGDGAGKELWKYDGVNPPTRALDLYSGATGSDPSDLFASANFLFFAADGNDGAGRELWRYNGVNAPVRISNLNTTGDSDPSHFARLNGFIYFSATNGTSGQELWKTDGVNPASLVMDIYPGSSDAYIEYTVTFNNKIYFAADDGNTGVQLWEYDGTNPPVQSTTLCPVSGDSNPKYMAVFNSKLFFGAEGCNGAGQEFWSYDGTTAPIMTADINKEGNNSYPSHLVSFNNKLYFSSRSNNAIGEELWVFDGTNPPSLVADIYPGSRDSDFSYPVVLNNVLYFSANGGDSAGLELWKYDGTNAPARVADINSGSNSSSPGALTIFNNAIYFAAYTSSTGGELWKYDGINPPSLVADIWAGTGSGTNSSGMAVLNNILYFHGNGNDGAGGELWNYDGVNPPSRVADIVSGVGGSFPKDLTVFNNTLYFQGYSPAEGFELWMYDGVNPPALAADLNPGAGNSYPAHLVAFNGKLYFTAGDASYQYELWVYDGVNPPSVVYDLWPGDESSFPNYMTVFNNKLFFSADGHDGAGNELWSYNGSPQTLPTGWVGSVSVTSDKALVSVGRPHIGAEVASYDGFSSGSTTAFVPMLFKDAFGGDYDAALYIQNVSGSSASVTIQYYDSSGVLNCTKADTIAPLASKGYWLPAATCDTGSLPTGWVGGVKVTSNHPIVAVGRPHIGSEVMTYNGFSSGSTSAFIPMLFKGAFGGSYNAAFYVQNVSGSSANVTLEYFDNTGTLNCTKSDTIASLASKGYWLPAATCDTGSLPAGWVGGVRVSSSQPVVTVGRPHIDTQITTYDGFSAGANSAYVPMLFKGAFGGSYNAAFYLQNVSNSSASVTIKYYDNAGTLNCTKADTIAPLASKGYWLPAATCDTGSLPAGWVGGVEVSSDQPIVSVGRPHIDAQVTTYNGFTAGATDVFLPMLFKDAFGGSYDSAFYLQNTEATAATVTIQFYDSTGALTCSRSDTIQPRATLGFWVPSATCFP